MKAIHICQLGQSQLLLELTACSLARHGQSIVITNADGIEVASMQLAAGYIVFDTSAVAASISPLRPMDFPISKTLRA